MRFRPSELSVGAEYELQLLDRRSLDLADDIDALLAACPDRRYVTPEYFKPTVEIVSRVCPDVGELERHLLGQVGMLQKAARSAGLSLAGAGTHPFSRRQVGTNPKLRYHRVRAITGKASLLQVTYGLHVHVGLRSGEEAIRVMSRLRPYLPLLLAMSANSPYWHGLDSGFASYRQRMLMTLHAFGLPPRLPDWASFERLSAVSSRAGVFHGLKDMHWDLRPRPDFGTLEIRVMDAQCTVAETVSLAAVCQALVLYLRDAAPAQVHLPELPEWIEQENHYRAALAGLEAECIVDDEGGLRPMRELAVQVLDDLLPLGPRLGSSAQLQAARERLTLAETPAERQRRSLRRDGSLERTLAEMVSALAEEARRVH